MASGEIASLYVKIGANIKDLEEGLKNTSSMLKGMVTSLESIGKSLTLGITVPLLGIGAAAVKAGLELDTQMRNIQSISQDTDQSIGVLRSSFIDLSTDMSKTTASAKELAAGYYQIQSSGFAGADAMQVLESAAMASTAGITSVATAAAAITASLNAYGEGADQAAAYSDILFRAVDIGVMTFDELATSMSNVTPTASAMGVSFDQVAAAMATMTKQGFSASEASVGLNQVLMNMMDPSVALSEALADMGYSSGQAALEALGLQGVLSGLEAAGYDTAAEMSQLFTNVRSLRGALALTGDGAQMFAKDLDAISNSSGAMQAAFEQQMKSIENRLANVKNKTTAALLGIFDALEPALNASLDMVNKLLDAFNDMPEASQNIVIGIGAIAAAAGPAMTVFAKLAGLVGKVTGGAAGLAGAATLPMGLVAGAVALGGVIAVLDTVARQEEKIAAAEAEAARTSGEYINVINDQAKSTEGLGDSAAEASLQIGSLTSAQKTLSSTIQDVPYQEYLNYMYRTGQMLAIQSEEELRLSRATDAATLAYQEQAEAAENTAKSMEYLEAAQEAGIITMQELGAMQDELAANDGNLTESTKELINARMDMIKSIDLANNVMQQYNVESGLQTQVQNAMRESVGLTVAAMTEQEKSFAMLTQAQQAGLLTQEQYIGYMTQAAQSAEGLGVAINAVIAAELEHNGIQWEAAEAARLAGEAMAQQAVATYDLAGQFQNASTATEQAGIAFSFITQQWQAGAMTGPQLTAALSSINDQFGIYSPKALQAASGMMQLTTAMSQGKIEATNFGPALQMMFDNIAAGKDPLDGLVENFGTAQAKIEDMAKKLPQKLDAMTDDMYDKMRKGYEDFKGAYDEASALPDLATKIEINTNAAAAAGEIEQATTAISALQSKTVTVTVHYRVIGDMGFGGGGTGGTDFTNSYGAQDANPFAGMLVASSVGSTDFSTGDVTATTTPTDVFSKTSTATQSTPPTYVDNSTVNVYDPLAAAILVEQKHTDRVSALDSVLTR